MLELLREMKGGCVGLWREEDGEDPLCWLGGVFRGKRWHSSRTRPNRASPGCHLHDNAVGVEVGGGLGDLGLGGGGRHVD